LIDLIDLLYDDVMLNVRRYDRYSLSGQCTEKNSSPSSRCMS